MVNSGERRLEPVERLSRRTSANNRSRKTSTPDEFIGVLEANGLPEHARVYRATVELAGALKEIGGRALLVGGCIRDMLAHKIPKDFDIEVYNLQPEQIEEVARRFGKVSEVGKAFGILKISLGEGWILTCHCRAPIQRQEPGIKVLKSVSIRTCR